MPASSKVLKPKMLGWFQPQGFEGGIDRANHQAGVRAEANQAKALVASLAGISGIDRNDPRADPPLLRTALQFQDEFAHARPFPMAEMAVAGGKIGRAEKNHFESGDGEQVIEVFGCVARFDHRNDHRLAVGFGEVLAEGHAPFHGALAADAANPGGGITAKAETGFKVGPGAHEWQYDAMDPNIESALDGALLYVGHADEDGGFGTADGAGVVDELVPVEVAVLEVNGDP